MTRILIVDDHPLVRRGIAQVLGTGLVDTLIGEAADEAEALAAIWSQPWNLVLLDISLPGRGGVELLKEIKAARPKLPVLIVSAHPESQFATRALRAGAAGYLTKDSTPETLVRAIHHVLSGGRYISAALAETLAAELADDPLVPLHQLLSDREYDVMLRLAAGQSVSKAAEAMNLSTKTVSTYRTRILDKMRITTNAGLTQYALRNQLIE